MKNNYMICMMAILSLYNIGINAVEPQSSDVKNTVQKTKEEWARERKESIIRTLKDAKSKILNYGDRDIFNIDMINQEGLGGGNWLELDNWLETTYASSAIRELAKRHFDLVRKYLNGTATMDDLMPAISEISKMNFISF